MHALYKKHYYDVMKSGQEDTILESDTSNENCEREDTPASEVGCYARPHLKSNSAQTHYSRNNKNFRNEYTFTSDEDSAVTLYCTINRGCSIGHSRSYEDVASIRSRSSHASGVSNQQHSLLQTDVNFFPYLNKTKEFALESRDTITKKDDDEATQCKCVQSKNMISNSDEHQHVSTNRGLAACRTFTLGSPESRRLQNNHCTTKLIGGCRVPVCKNFRSRF